MNRSPAVPTNMVKKVSKFLKGFNGSSSPKKGGGSGFGGGGSGSVRVLKRGHAMRVIFFYPGEEGTYVDNAIVTLFENGVIHIESNQEETTTHLQNCEILWRFETETSEEQRTNKVRLLKLKGERAGASAESTSSEKGKGSSHKDSDGKDSPKNPDLR